MGDPLSHPQVSLSWSNTEAEPGDEVVLRVTTEEPASLVGVLVVDKAAKRGGSYNDISKDSVSPGSLLAPRSQLTAPPAATGCVRGPPPPPPWMDEALQLFGQAEVEGQQCRLLLPSVRVSVVQG